MRRERGHITKRGNSYSVVLDVYDKDGKRRRKWIAVKGGSTEAQRKLTELLRAKDMGTFTAPKKIKVAEFLVQWIDTYSENLKAIRSRERYADIINRYFIPRIGKITLSQLTPGQLQALYSEWLKQGLSGATVNMHHNVIHRALKSAVKWEYIGRNVADGLDLPKEQHHEMQIWDESEVAKFLDYAKDGLYYEVFYLALFSGMRRSEIMALRWADVDLLTGQVRITRGLQRTRDSSLVFTEPKTAKSRRTIDLPPSATLLLKDYRDRKALDRALKGKTLNETDLIFCHENGKPIRPDNITHAWTVTAKRAGVKHIRLHDARHTHASLMLAQGIHPKIVQERLGHSTISMTLDTYSHVIPGLQEAAAKSFDSLFTRPAGNATSKKETEKI